MRIHRFWSWLAALACALVTALAVAQPAPPPAEVKPAPAAPGDAAAPDAAPAGDEVTRAREAFLRGLTQAKGRNFAGAISEFQSSIALFPTRAAHSNLALCLTELGRFVEARDTYTRILNEYKDSLPAGERADIATQLEALARHIGQISVTSVPEGAAVIVDGQRRGQTPLAEPIAVDAGPHSVRVFHPGYAALEASLSVPAGGLGEVRAVLEAARRLGTLAVRETSGKSLDVLVNGAVVGKTPYQGALPPGSYSISLAGAEGIGTGPSAATVRADEVQNLVLTAGVLDSELRVEPTPSNAQVQIDGVTVGNGVWQGALPSGEHRVDVSAEGLRSEQRVVVTRKGERSALSILLDCPVAAPAEPPHRLYVELVGGLAFAPSLGGSADESCSQTLLAPDDMTRVDGCSERARPLGFMAGARIGYQVTPRLGVDVFFGYLRLKESMTRNIYALFEGQQENPVFSSDYRDTTTLAGAAFAIAPSYRFLDKTPITLRLWFGLGRFQVNATNGGNFDGAVTFDGEPGVGVHDHVSAEEVPVATWLPFLGPELRVGYQFTRHLSADFGVAALLLMPADIWRFGTFQRDERRRRVPIEIQTAAGSRNAVVQLPEELALGVTVALVPSIAARWSF